MKKKNDLKDMEIDSWKYREKRFEKKERKKDDFTVNKEKRMNEIKRKIKNWKKKKFRV